MKDETIVLHEAIVRVTTQALEAHHTLIEEHLKIVLKPKPKWCSFALWQWLLHQLIHVDRRVIK